MNRGHLKLFSMSRNINQLLQKPRSNQRPTHRRRSMKKKSFFNTVNEEGEIITTVWNGIQFKFRNWVPQNMSMVVGKPDEHGVQEVVIIKNLAHPTKRRRKT